MQPDGAFAPPRHILVVERDMIVGMGLAEDLAELGFRVSGPFCASPDAIALLDSDPPDAAIVDVGLRDGTGHATARLLHSRRIPLVLFTAGSRARHLEGELHGLPWVDKPASTDCILRALGLGGMVEDVRRSA